MVGVVVEQTVEKVDGFLVLTHRHINSGFLELEIVCTGPVDGVIYMFQRQVEIAIFGISSRNQ